MLNYCANGPSGYNLTNSLRFRSSASASLTRTFGTPTSGQKWTMSFWFKRGILGVGQELFAKGNTSTQPWTFFYIDGNGALNLYEYSTSGTSPNFNLATNAVFRDPSSWYHIVVAVDTTQATAANRQIVYVNNVQQTFSSSSFYPQNTITTWNSSGGTSYIGRQGGGDYLDGYLTEINFIDGQALTPSSFGSTNPVTGVWQPAKYTGTYGTNGFYLNFTDIALTSGSNTGLGKDFSGNGNYWNTNNISVTAGTTYDAMLDVPTNTSATVANYATMNPIGSFVSGSSATFTNGNMSVSIPSVGSPPRNVTCTFAVSSGKYYWEFTAQTIGTVLDFGVASTAMNFNASIFTTGSFIYDNGGTKIINGTQTAYGASYTTGDVLGVALDMDSGTITFYKNNVSQGIASSALSGLTVTPIMVAGGGAACSGDFNFGQRPFTYTPPTGYVALNTYNLPTSTIVKGNSYMDATLYTGNGSAQTITNAGGFRPDLVWQKPRSEVASHRLVDSVRGVNNVLYSNQTASATTETNTLTAFNSNGFTGGGSNAVTSGNTAVAWQWQAGQGTNTTNTAGSITSTTSVSTTAGFSVVTFNATSTNATIGHGLGVAPRMIIVKGRNNVQDWYVYNANLGAGKYILLNAGGASITDTGLWQNTTPTSSVFYIGASFGTINYVAYCWAEIAGFSRFGSYVGNGSTNGPFVYLGFRPEFVMVKGDVAGVDWVISDATRNTSNVVNRRLFPANTNAEDTSDNWCDFLSNGFKIRSTNTNQNFNSNTFIYMAFAENPFKNALAR